jgi:predicted metalloprotease
MRWTPGQTSQDVEDRRAEGGGRRGGGGLRVGLVGILILLGLSLLTGRNFLSLLDTSQPIGPGTGSSVPDPQRDAQEEPLVKFVSFVLDDTQATWQKLLPEYRRAKLVLFRDGIDSACGFAETASGPFYCPGDEKVYVDLAFYEELKQRFGAPGDFAQAYVIAHEIGHHVQNVTGIEPKVRQRQQARPSEANALSVRMELQADCFAGVWGHSTAQRSILEGGDVEEGLGAASAIGDDRIQGQAGRRVNPESFTHGSSRQRVAWFKRGLETGDVRQCDTFQLPDPS